MKNSKAVSKTPDPLKTILMKIGNWLKKNYSTAAVFLLIIILSNVSVSATGTTTPVATETAATSLWTTISELIEEWVTKLGGVVMFVGGIMFALGWKNDDAEGKSRGINTMISGALVIAIAAVTTNFF